MEQNREVAVEVADDSWRVDTCADTPHECGQCAEKVHTGEEVFLLQICKPILVINGTTKVELRPELTEDGHPLYPPYFMHSQCWEEVQDDLNEIAEESNPARVAGAICSCKLCNSGITPSELVLTVQFGELLHAKQRVEDESIRFYGSGDTDVICAECLEELNTQIVGLWDEEFVEYEEEECASLYTP